ncbi:hypothetical protein [uncultured Clostridium sp.]|uniref:hypothetical protein n=1 Tax=uncultured Clostridium sp. TaxID=59620 RepID=UPI003216D8DD
MYQMFEHMDCVDVGVKIKLNENLTVQFHNNNHVVGATSISVFIRKPNNKVVHILYSSDMGNSLTQDLQPFLKSEDLPRKCNLFISEATYNNPERSFNRKDAIRERKELCELLKNAMQENKRVLFATFSFARSQALISLLYDELKDEEWFQETPVVMDGLLMNNINSTYLRVLEEDDKKYFEEVLSMRNLKLNKGYDGTIACLSKRTSGIYFASSGFCSAGRILSYLPSFLGSKKDIVILTGYCGAEGSVGWKLMNPNQKTVTIEKNVIGKRAEIRQLKTFSSHIGYQQLLDLYCEMRCDKILVHHSDEGKYKFCEDAKNYLKSKGSTTQVVPVDKGSNQFIL